MADTIEARLAAEGVVLPTPAAPAANYLPYMISGQLLFTAGQLPLADGKLLASGLLGRDVDTQTGQKAALGDLERIGRLVKITVFVASTPDFTEQHLVANGASDFLAKVLGDAGKHARSAVGTASLPLNAAVEIEAIIEIAQ